MFTKSLTEKQSKFFNFILQYGREHENFPSYQAMIDQTWVNSKNGVHQYLQALREKNYIQKDQWGRYKLHPSKQYLIDQPDNPIPIRGIITAGAMQEAVAADLGSLSVRNLFPQAKNPFSLRVEGTSMIEAGIHDSDLVILDHTEIASGDIGALQYNGSTTLKEIHLDETRVVLNPKSKNHTPIVLEPAEFEEIRVIGKYVAHFHQGRVCYIN